MHWRGHIEYMESLHSVYIVFPHILPKPYCSKSCDTLNKNKFEHQQGQASRTETHSMEIWVLFTINHMAEIFKSSSFPIGSWCYWKESPLRMWYSPQESWTVVLHNYASWALTICHTQNTCSLEIYLFYLLYPASSYTKAQPYSCKSWQAKETVKLITWVGIYGIRYFHNDYN